MAAAMAKRKLKQGIDTEVHPPSASGSNPPGEPTFLLGPLQIPEEVPGPPSNAPGSSNPNEEGVLRRVAGAEGAPVGSPPPKSSPEGSPSASRQGSLEPSILGENNTKMSADTLPVASDAQPK